MMVCVGVRKLGGDGNGATLRFNTAVGTLPPLRPLWEITAAATHDTHEQDTNTATSTDDIKHDDGTSSSATVTSLTSRPSPATATATTTTTEASAAPITAGAISTPPLSSLLP
jgi:hypothetical protein